MINVEHFQIVEVNKAPDADTLYLTKIDIGGEYLSVVAGLTKFLTVDELIGRNVVVLCNLKPSKLRGHLSEGNQIKKKKKFTEENTKRLISDDSVSNLTRHNYDK